MYEYIKGIVAEKRNDIIIIDNNNIGYSIFTSINTLAKTEMNETYKIYTYLHVREDIMKLYGFIDKDELNLFIMLISISGVGPKAGLSILSTLTPKEIALAIATGDDKVLSKAKGIGKKTAQRIILELKDKFKSLQIEQMDDTIITSDNNIAEEAVTALMVLGYKSKESKTIINKVIDKDDTIEMLIKKALNHISN